ncbi:peptidase S41 [Lysobacter concretionis Ko07 = DSM 16239]|uniref:Peptidase S41 n=1 Tax=Lysobacter concretionis Ko07 = DSM 16239 TaxID=1122185 RepID=A0A0A0EJC3_9GAMM|nr:MULTISPECIES: S41 family peptidase [Lysobacter]KGM51086.1 peptidase S41 [Lysobacter concretionis Ko07 = DSM 16239]
MSLRRLSPLALAIALAFCLPMAVAQERQPAAPVPALPAPEAAPQNTGEHPSASPVQGHPVQEGEQATPAANEEPPAGQDEPRGGQPRTDESSADSPGSSDSNIPLDEIRRYVAVYKAIKAAYVEPVGDHKLMQSAIRGLLLDLDPHSAYLEGDAAVNFDEQSRGNYEGIGVEILRQADGTLRVIAPIDDTPAARAGIKAGDVIVAVDGVPLTPSDDDNSASLRGKAGTKLELTVLREGEAEPLKLIVERQTIRIASVRGRMLEPGYGYIRISAFQADTAADFERQLEALNQQAGGRLRGLVMDLRSNPGGLLTAAVQIADALLDSGTIVSTRGRIPISDAMFSATPGDRLQGAPVVVLVDAGSASASEVLAGALSDNGRAVVVGSRTFGKGSVQTVLPLDNGDSVKLTTARYYTPSGKSIQALGVVPAVLLHADQSAGHGGRMGYTEASLPGHLDGEGDQRSGEQAGEVLEGDSYITAALGELKKLATKPKPKR